MSLPDRFASIDTYSSFQRRHKKRTRIFPRLEKCILRLRVDAGGKSSLSKEILIRWVKEGRGPGLSFVVASQQPSAIDMEVLSQCDVILSHSMTVSEDKTALNRLTKDYMGGELRTYIDKIARTGQAVLVDDDVERVSMVHVRPRKTKPGGSEA